MPEEEEFKDISDDSEEEGETKKVSRVPLPRGKEIIGIIEQRLGGNKMMVSCMDGKTRNCRVPGRLKRALWLRPNDVVIVEPWEFDGDKADILLKYKPNQVDWLRKNNYLKAKSEEF